MAVERQWAPPCRQCRQPTCVYCDRLGEADRNEAWQRPLGRAGPDCIDFFPLPPIPRRSDDHIIRRGPLTPRGTESHAARRCSKGSRIFIKCEHPQCSRPLWNWGRFRNALLGVRGSVQGPTSSTGHGQCHQRSSHQKQSATMRPFHELRERGVGGGGGTKGSGCRLHCRVRIWEYLAMPYEDHVTRLQCTVGYPPSLEAALSALISVSSTYL